MTDQLPALPKVGGPITAKAVERIEAEVAQHVLLVDDLDLLLEWRDQAAALYAYLHSKGLHAPMAGAQRRVEARIGQLLGQAVPGRYQSTSRTSDIERRDDRADFRILAQAFELLKEAETDWRRSRRALVALITNMLGHQKAAEVAKNVPSFAASYDVRKCECIEGLKLPQSSVDCIITDPPYPREFIPHYRELSAVAAHALKPGGSLIAMVGQSWLPEVMAELGSSLRYHWTMTYLTPGQSPLSISVRKRVNTRWKPVLWYVNGEYTGPVITDDVFRSANEDKRFHRWGQSESGMAEIVERFSKPGDVVLDPFMGAGTTGVVSVALSRTFIGFDPDEKSYNAALARLSEKAAA